MKVTVLVDNYVPNDDDLRGEPSFACYIDTDDIKILFDLGMTCIPYDNARKVGIDLSAVNAVVLSHGHLDHTWGLDCFIKRYRPNKTTKLICHPDALKEKKYKRFKIGIKQNVKYLEEHFEVVRCKKSYWINKKMVFLGEVERTTQFENKEPLGKQKNGDKFEDDFILDDSALVFDGEDGMMIITGCSHSGICNIIEYSKKVIGKSKIKTIIGGLHLQSTKDNEVSKKTIEYLRNQDIKVFYPSHCTNLYNKIEISKIVNVGEVGSGTLIEYDKI